MKTFSTASARKAADRAATTTPGIIETMNELTASLFQFGSAERARLHASIGVPGDVETATLFMPRGDVYFAVDTDLLPIDQDALKCVAASGRDCIIVRVDQHSGTLPPLFTIAINKGKKFEIIEDYLLALNSRDGVFVNLRPGPPAWRYMNGRLKKTKVPACR